MFMGKSYYIGAITGGISYLLRALFTADDQGFSDEQVLGAAEGVEDGSLTVIENDGTLAISSNACAFTAQSTPVWGDLGFYSNSITKVLGLPIFFTINLSTWEEMGVGLDDTAAVNDPDNFIYAIQANATDGQIDNENGTAILTGLSASTDYKFALVLGGFDSNGTPYYTGQTKTNYKYGAWLFYYDGSNWNLIWFDVADNTSTLYFILSVLDAAGYIDTIKAIDVDVSTVQEQIAHFSSFDAANGTSLDAITPEVGSGWTEQQGDWDIQSNKANPTGADPGGVHWVATVDASVADVLVKCIVRTSPNIIGRYSDNDNLWMVQLNVFNNKNYIYERNGGSFTLRASTDVTIDVDTDYDAIIVYNGQTISSFVDGGNRASYSSASLNETETEFGLRSFDAVGDVYNNFMVFPITDANYDTTLDTY